MNLIDIFHNISPNVISLPPLSLSSVASFLPCFQQLNEISVVVLVFIILMAPLKNVGLELDAEGFNVSSQRVSG